MVHVLLVLAVIVLFIAGFYFSLQRYRDLLLPDERGEFDRK